MHRLSAYIGPVHSEKSTRAAQTARRYERLGNTVKLLRPRCSIRPDPEGPENGDRPGRLVTKSRKIRIEFPSTEFDSFSEIPDAAAGADVVWFDELMLAEAQEPGRWLAAFNIVQEIRQYATVLVSGLSSTSELETFGRLTGALLSVADEVVMCRADCDFCGTFESATRSVCTREKSGQVLVGGEEAYKAACPECWVQYSAAELTV